MIDTRLAPYGLFAIRAALGIMFIAHALLKYFVFTIPGFAQFLGMVGLPTALAWPIFLAELLGGVAILVGFYGRWVSAALLPVLLGALAIHAPNGWLFNVPERRLGIPGLPRRRGPGPCARRRRRLCGEAGRAADPLGSCGLAEGRLRPRPVHRLGTASGDAVPFVSRRGFSALALATFAPPRARRRSLIASPNPASGTGATAIVAAPEASSARSAENRRAAASETLPFWLRFTTIDAFAVPAGTASPKSRTASPGATLVAFRRTRARGA